MDVNQYIEIYHRTDLSGLNDAVGALRGQHQVDVLQSLEEKGYKILWHQGRDRAADADAGVVVAGPGH